MFGQARGGISAYQKVGVDAAVAQYVGVDHPAAGDLQPAALQGAAHEGHVDLGGRLGEREEGRTETHLQVVALEEVAQEIGDHALQVGEAHRLADPQAFDLVEHGRVGGVGIDAVHAARRDHAQLGHRVAILVGRHVGLHGADLDRAGVRAQQHVVAVFQVEGVVHRTRRVILGRIQCCEIVEILFDFRAIGDFETDRGEQGFDALQRARHRVQATTGFGTTRQRNVQCLFSQARLQCSLADIFATLVECILNGGLGDVDRSTGGFLLLGRQLAQALQEFGNLAALAKVACLRLSSHF